MKKLLSTVLMLSAVNAFALSVGVSVTDSSCSESGDQGSFRIRRDVASSTSLTVYYSLSGTAINGVDYKTLSGYVTIPANLYSATIPVIPLRDSLVEGIQNVRLTIKASTRYAISTSSASLNLLDATAVIANYALSVSRSGMGPGDVSSSPAGIVCGSDCSQEYSANTIVTLTATPTAGVVFAGWTGACTGLGACAVTMNAAKSVNAQFNFGSAPTANQLPTVSLSSPASGASIIQGNAVAIAASASDADGSIKRVEFYDGASKIGEDLTSPYSISVTNLALGSHSLKARAIDNLDAAKDSAARTISVMSTQDPIPNGTKIDCAIQKCFYVTQFGGVVKDGSNWSNAYAGLPTTLQRGAVYFVAGGNYPTYTMNTPDNGQKILIKKASPTDHGTDVGYQTNFGMTQAFFANKITINQGNVTLDGSYRDESDWFDGGAYGFKIGITGADVWTHLAIGNGSKPCPNVVIRNLFIAAIVGRLPAAGTGGRPYAIDTSTGDNSMMNTGIVFHRVYVEGSNNPFFLRQTKMPLVEYCASRFTSGSSTFHGEMVNLYYLYSGGGTVRYSHFRDAYNGRSGYNKGGGTGVIAIAEVGTAIGCTEATCSTSIYGNIFQDYYVGDGAIAAGFVNKWVKVYNNTFINTYYDPEDKMILGSNAIRLQASGTNDRGNEARNNLMQGPKAGTNGIGTFSHNSIVDLSIFEDPNLNNFRLKQHTEAGMNLSAPYNEDMDGELRGQGGWDRGAFQLAD